MLDPHLNFEPLIGLDILLGRILNHTRLTNEWLLGELKAGNLLTTHGLVYLVSHGPLEPKYRSQPLLAAEPYSAACSLHDLL